MELVNRLIKARRGDLAEKLKKTWRNAVVFLDNTTLKEGEIPIGTSKIGGYPDLPPEVEYPEMSGFKWMESNHEFGTISRSAMQLVAQINLYELAKTGADIENVLPKKGMLYFFFCTHYGFVVHPEYMPYFNPIEETRYHMIEVDNPELTQVAKVIYWDGDMSTLRRTVPTSPYYGGICIQEEQPITFCSEDNYDTMRLDEDAYEEICNILQIFYVDAFVPMSKYTEKLLGVPWTIDGMHRMSNDEVNLFQARDFRYGYLSDYLTIGKDSLQNKDFSIVWLYEDFG